MADSPTRVSAAAPRGTEERLDSWKEIALYLRRDVSTVQRWEKHEHLPIRRHLHEKLGSVYALKSEIDAWLKSRCGRPQWDGVPPQQESPATAGVTARLESISATLDPTHPSIAVLPFSNLSRDADDEYFSDGLAEEVINTLTNVSGLKVIARTSAFAFKGRHEDVRRVAQALGVTTVLQGSVRRAADRLRVIAKLIDVSDGTHLWSERYDRQLTDVFAVQDEIAAAIVRALKVTLSQSAAAVGPHQPSLAAYEAFLKGRHHLPSKSVIDAADASARAEDFFKQAIGLDPHWVEPHAALAHLYFFLGRLGLRPLGKTVAAARAEAEKALELLPSDATSHAVLGAITSSYDYDWKAAGEHFRFAIASEFLPPAVRDLYAGSYLLPLGRFEEAIEQHTKAITQDPLNMLWRTRRFGPLLFMGQYERAIDEARKVLEFDEQTFLAHFVIAQAHFFEGRVAEARASAEEAFRQAPWHAPATGLLAGLVAETGETERAQNLIATMQGITTIGMIFYHVVRFEIDAAIDWYERAIEERQPFAAELVWNGLLRSSPRWPNLARLMNLPLPH